jgi:hypothetical protein
VEDNSARCRSSALPFPAVSATTDSLIGIVPRLSAAQQGAQDKLS